MRRDFDSLRQRVEELLRDKGFRLAPERVWRFARFARVAHYVATDGSGRLSVLVSLHEDSERYSRLPDVERLRASLGNTPLGQTLANTIRYDVIEYRRVGGRLELRYLPGVTIKKPRVSAAQLAREQEALRRGQCVRRNRRANTWRTAALSTAPVGLSFGGCRW